jgi:hypothetical protein
MGEQPNDSSAAAAIKWYSQNSVDEFLAAASEERGRLEAVIADATARAERARAALGVHRLMATMLLDTHRQLTERRREAELEAAQIIIDSERDAHRLLEAARAEHPFSPRPVRAEVPGDTVIDLTSKSDQSVPAPVIPTPAAPVVPTRAAPVVPPDAPPLVPPAAPPLATAAPPLATEAPTNGDGRVEDDDTFFAELRAAVGSPDEFGPRPQ